MEKNSSLPNNIILTGLSNRELQSVKNIVLTGSIKGAAKCMNISPRTLEVYLRNVRNKLGLQYKSQLNKIFIDNFYTEKNI